MTVADEPAWVADPNVIWNILLVARPLVPPAVSDLTSRLQALAADHGWQVPPVGTHPTVAEAVTRLSSTALAGPLEVVVAEESIVVAAHHSAVDGLGLLAVLGALTGLPVSSSARGVGDRGDRGSLGSAVARRAAEVAFVPPATIAPTRARSTTERPAVSVELPGSLSTARLVHAAAAAVVAHNARHGHHRRRPVVIAVGASRRGGSEPQVGDFSALLRLRDVGGLSVDALRDLLRAAPTEPAPSGAPGSASLAVRVAGVGVRLLARRLGSTLLVSHLGEVSAPGLEGLLFLPVTGGGSGLALGAVTLAGRTTLGLRDSSGRQRPDVLQLLLEDVRDELGQA